LQGLSKTPTTMQIRFRAFFRRHFCATFQLCDKAMKDLCVELINKFFGIIGFVEVLWRLLWEVILPPKDLKNLEEQVSFLNFKILLYDHSI
jgi:hypothetical protein